MVASMTPADGTRVVRGGVGIPWLRRGDPAACDEEADLDAIRCTAEASCSAMMISPIDIAESSSVNEMGRLVLLEAMEEDGSSGWVAPGSENVVSTWMPRPARLTGEGGVSSRLITTVADWVVGEGQLVMGTLEDVEERGGVPKGSWKITPSWTSFHDGDRMGILLFLFDRAAIEGPVEVKVEADKEEGEEGDGKGEVLVEVSAGNLKLLIVSV